VVSIFLLIAGFRHPLELQNLLNFHWVVQLEEIAFDLPAIVGLGFPAQSVFDSTP
jgi:hypothetical protein